MYKTCAFSWEPEVTDAFYTTSCSQHNKSGRSARLKKGKAISFWFCGRKKAYQHFAVFFTWQSTFRGIIKKVSWMPLFHILSYFKNVLIIAVTTLNKPRWNDCILYITSTTFSYSCLWRAFTFHIWDSPSDLTQWGLLRQLYNYSEKKKKSQRVSFFTKSKGGVSSSTGNRHTGHHSNPCCMWVTWMKSVKFISPELVQRTWKTGSALTALLALAQGWRTSYPSKGMVCASWSHTQSRKTR